MPTPAIRPWELAVSCRNLSLPYLRERYAAGIRWIEVAPVDLRQVSAEQRPERMAEIARNVRESQLAVWSIHIPFGGDWDISALDGEQRRQALENVRGVLDLCRALQPARAVIHASAEPIPDAERPARMAAAHGSLREVAKEFAAAGVQLALENLPRTCLGNCAQEILQLTDGIPGIGLCLDTNHLLKETHAQYLAKVARNIVTLHCSDYDGVDDRHWFPGEGIVPWGLVRQMLSEAGYAGPFLIECWKHKDGRAVEAKEYAVP